MATQTWSTVYDHSSDAGFRAWGSELATKFAAAGLIQTADTGQINWVTVTRPGVNTIAGYEIWKFPDSSIYFKLQYGTFTTTTAPKMTIQFGTGSNGSGTLTGQLSTATDIQISSGSTGAGSNAIARASYLCVTDDFFGLAWKTQGSLNGYAVAFVSCQKWVDSAGDPVSDGFTVHYRGTSGTAPGTSIRSETVRTASVASTSGLSSRHVLIPYDISNSAVGGDNQVFLHFIPQPRIMPLLFTFSHVDSELALSTTLTATPVGATSHTYIALNTQCGTCGNASGDGYGIAMLWE